MSFGGPEMIIVLILVLVLFGGSQLPKLARNLGKAQKEFKDGIADANKPGDPADPADPASGASAKTSADDTSA
jgi:sec-independent protein translocase protein TatA